MHILITHTHKYTHTHACTHTRTYARAHTHTHTPGTDESLAAGDTPAVPDIYQTQHMIWSQREKKNKFH